MLRSWHNKKSDILESFNLAKLCLNSKYNRDVPTYLPNKFMTWVFALYGYIIPIFRSEILMLWSFYWWNWPLRHLFYSFKAFIIWICSNFFSIFTVKYQNYEPNWSWRKKIKKLQEMFEGMGSHPQCIFGPPFFITPLKIQNLIF